MMNILLKTVGLLFFPCLVFADTQCIAVKVSDGDTFTCKGTYQRLIQVRLADIDAPESGQAYGNQARKKLNSLIYKKTVRLTNERQDKYGRVVATVFSGSQNVNFAMIESGYVWHYERYSNNKQYAAAQKLAQSQRRGLWADKGKIIKPEQWRHRYKLSQKKCSDCLIAYRSLPLFPFSLD